MERGFNDVEALEEVSVVVELPCKEVVEITKL